MSTINLRPFLLTLFVFPILGHSASNLIIPDEEWLIKDTKSGCKMIDPLPEKGKTVQWSGKCIDGFAHGYGTQTWFLNGKHYGTDKVYMDKGFIIGAGKVGNNRRGGFWRYTFTANSPSGEHSCKLRLPIASNRQSFRDMFEVRVEGRRGKCGIGTKKNQTVDIYFNNQFFGKYEGDLIRAILPVGGKLTLFTGSVYQVGKDSRNGYDKVDWIEWMETTKLVQPAELGNSQYDDKNFDIKMGLNTFSDSTSFDTDYGKKTSLAIEPLHNIVYLDYDITPKQSIDSDGLEVKIRVTIDYTEHVKNGLLTSSQRKQVSKDVKIMLRKEDNFTANNKLEITRFDVFKSDEDKDVEINLDDFNAKVEIISFDEQ